MTPIQKIVREYRIQQGNGKTLSLREFAHELSRPLEAIRMSITYGSIQNWESGKYKPDDDRIHALIIFAAPNSWQWHFANDLKAAKYPRVHWPTGEIGKRLLEMEEHEDDSAA